MATFLNQIGTKWNQGRNQVKFKEALHDSKTFVERPYSYYNTN
jgi:hypothetical protein